MTADISSIRRLFLVVRFKIFHRNQGQEICFERGSFKVLHHHSSKCTYCCHKEGIKNKGIQSGERPVVFQDDVRDSAVT